MQRLRFSEENPDKKVILVSKDVNLRLKAKAFNITAEDFQTGKIKDLDQLYTGKSTINGIDPELVDKIYKEGFCSPDEIGVKDPIPNHYFILKNDKTSIFTY